MTVCSRDERGEGKETRGQLFYMISNKRSSTSMHVGKGSFGPGTQSGARTPRSEHVSSPPATNEREHCAWELGTWRNYSAILEGI